MLQAFESKIQAIESEDEIYSQMFRELKEHGPNYPVLFRIINCIPIFLKHV